MDLHQSSQSSQDPFGWIDHELSELRQRALFREARTSCSHGAGRIERDGQLFWNFADNDYLGLSSHPQVIAAAKAACSKSVGAKASPLITGRSEELAALEAELARFEGTEASLVFPTGFAANFGAICGLVGRDDVIFCDRLNHASLIDGARHSGARFRVFPHRDMNRLRVELSRAESFRRRLILSDSYFSMDGDVAPLQALISLAEEFNAMLLIDEAHATGVFGETGVGLLESVKSHSQHVVVVGTLSKALGGQGGFVAATQAICSWLRNSARVGIYSTALAPPLCAAAQAALNVIRDEPHRRDWLLAQSRYVAEQLRDSGWNVPADVVGPIIPVLIGDAAKTMAMADRLREQGVLVAAIRPPTVRQGSSRLRLSLSYSQGDAGIASLLQALHAVQDDR